jgi:hypothetical protein
MNTIKKLAFIALTFTSFSVNAQTNKATTAKIIEEKNYIFVATTAIPLNSADVSAVLNKIPGSIGGGAISLSGNTYDLVVNADSIVSYLPYYGRAYRASFDSEENGHKFTSKNFTYKKTKRKKGGWDIAIATKDVKDNVRMTLTVSENGYATLNVISNDKQSISYNGYMMEEKKKEL